MARDVDDPASFEVAKAPAPTLVDNHLLARIAEADRPDFERRLEPIPLPKGHVLYEPGDPLTHVIFPTSGMIALIAVMSDGRATETAIVGREGAIGISASGYTDPAFNRYVVQIDGAGYRASAAEFEQMVDDSVGLCSAVARWRDVLLRMTLQSVACNILHNVRQRCARWILSTRDRTGADLFPVTQEALAQTLGVKRNAINLAAREMQREGAIRYVRGRLRIVDPDRLRAMACECYPLLLGEIEKLRADQPSSECDD